MIDMLYARYFRRQSEAGIGQQLVIHRRDGAPAGVIGIEVRQLHPQDGRLQFVEPRVVAVDVVEVAALDAVDAQHPELLGERLVVGHHHAAVARRAEVLGRIEAEASEHPVAGDRFAVASGADRLRAIFDQRDAQRRQIVEGGRLAKKVDRDDRLRPRGDAPGDLGRIERETARIDVGEDHAGADLMDALGRRDVGERRGDDLVARTDVEGAERERERVGPGIHPDAVLRPAERGDLLLERGDVRAEDVMAFGEDGLDGGEGLGAERGELRGGIEERDVHSERPGAEWIAPHERKRGFRRRRHGRPERCRGPGRRVQRPGRRAPLKRWLQ